MRKMKQLKFLSIIIVLASVVMFSSCKKDNSTEIDVKGQVVLSFDVQEAVKSGLKSTKNSITIGNIASVIVSIEDASGKLVYDTKEIELYNMNGSFISAPISLLTGNYKLVKFLVIDDTNNILYASPLENSSKAYLVNDPLPIDIIVNTDEVTKTTPEVLSTEGCTPEDFGYATFGLDIIETFDFLVGVFAYNDITANFELTDASISITNDGVSLYSGTLTAITNKITLRDDVDSCEILVTKSLYKSYQKVFAVSDLKKYFSSTEEGPLEIVLEKLNQLILQPNAENGKDASIFNNIPLNYINTNFGAHTEFIALEWTNNGNISDIRSLIDFDFSLLPNNINIVDAQLLLYTAENTLHGPGHSQLSGSNECILQRVTSNWEENTVTWNTQPTTTISNQVILPASQHDLLDYQINVTDLINDMINNPDSSFGFMLRLQTEAHYRRMLFVSSDYEDATKHPMLVIKYE